jgi:tight adherence protein C
LALTVFVLALAGAAAMYLAIYSAARVSRERLVLTPAISPHTADRGAANRVGNRLAALAGADRLIGQMTRQSRQSGGLNPTIKRLAVALGQAGYYGMRAVVIFRLSQLASVAAMALLGALVGLLYGRLVLSIVLFALMGYIAPRYILGRIGRQRLRRLGRELPAILDLLMVCLEAGLGLAESLRLVGRESERHGGVLGAELAITAGEVTAGVPLAESLRNLGVRVGTEELKSLTAILVQSHQMGSRLGPALRASAEQLATRRRMHAEEMAQKSAIKMLVPLVIFILPAMMIVVLGPAIIQLMRVLGR